MDIGTAKLPAEQRRGIPHHLLDVLDPRDEASVARYQVDARAVIDAVLARGHVPILVGGSGLYVSSVLYDFRFPGTDAAIRERLETELAAEGPGMLHRRLRAVDPVAAEAIGASNGRRLVRALEVVELTGEPFGAGLGAEQRPWRPSVTIGLRLDRSRLVERLDARVAGMWRDGLIDEVRGLLPGGLGVTASRAIGYAQAAAQIAGDLSEADAIAQAALLTRKYARRQMSWFGRFADTVWLDADDPERLAAARAAASA
jgi:tRNA dimethylallyltransferase